MDYRALLLFLLALQMTVSSMEVDGGEPQSVAVYDKRTLVESFGEFDGSFATLPDGFRVARDMDGAYLGAADIGEFKGLHDGGVVEGACYAWYLGNQKRALGCQPTANEYTAGMIELVMSNATARSYRFLQIGYDVVSLNNAGRSQQVRLMVSCDGQNYTDVPSLTYVTAQEADDVPTWTQVRLNTRIRLSDLIGRGDRLWMRWVFDDEAGDGHRDEVGITAVSIKLCGPDGTVLAFR